MFGENIYWKTETEVVVAITGKAIPKESLTNVWDKPITTIIAPTLEQTSAFEYDSEPL